MSLQSGSRLGGLKEIWFNVKGGGLLKHDGKDLQGAKDYCSRKDEGKDPRHWAFKSCG